MTAGISFKSLLVRLRSPYSLCVMATLPAWLALCISYGLLAGQAAQPMKITSIVAIIADPEKYDGKEVRVEGFVASYEGGTALFLSRESIDFNIFANAILVDDDSAENKEKFRREAPGKCCLLRGVITLGPPDRWMGACTLKLKRYEGWTPSANPMDSDQRPVKD